MKIAGIIYLLFTGTLFFVGLIVFFIGFTKPFNIHSIHIDYERYCFLFIYMIAINRFVNEYNKESNEV